MKPEDKAVVQQAQLIFSTMTVADDIDWVRSVAELQANALRQLLEQPVQEPMFYWDMDGFFVRPERAKFLNLDVDAMQALYATPPAQPVDHGDELTIAYLDGVHTGKQIAKREWVGLTDEEICGLIAFEGASLADFVRYVESMLRDKNAAPQPADWIGLMRGVRVDGDSVVISTKGNETARKLCEVLLKQKDAA